jgi:hypothetical protein
LQINYKSKLKRIIFDWSISNPMTNEIPKELSDKGFITTEQYEKIEPITSGKIISVFYELRSLLYLGILLFTGGIGILIYKNIGDIGHLISLSLLALFTLLCFIYIFKNSPAFIPEKSAPSTPYFDYIVLLGALLFISVLGYLQFLYNILDENAGASTLITASFFFYVAYRFDNIGVLSLAITALASFWSISASPQKWYSGDFFDNANLHITAIIFSIILAGISLVLDRRRIKQHFTFTYLNFCCLMFFVAAMVGLDKGLYGIYVLLIYGGCAFAYYMARWKKSFLFLLYAFIAAYIATTYLLAETVLREGIELWFFYSIISCGAFVYFIIRYKNHFNQKS